MDFDMQLGFIGLGNMGRNLVLNLQDDGHNVTAWNRSEEKRAIAREEGITVVDSIPELVDSLGSGRKVVWLMVAAGEAVDQILFNEGSLFELLGEGDVVVDGANSHYMDTKRRAEKLQEKGIRLLDCGVSGGITAARRGPSLMIGGDTEAFSFCKEIFESMAAEGGYGYFGSTGAGHYVKMVHNGIEYGMMQAIAEGVNLISHSEYSEGLEMAKLVDVWNNGAVIQSNLLGFLSDALKQDGDLNDIEPEIGTLGTGKWTAEEALRLGVPLTSITHAVHTRYLSWQGSSMLFKVIQAMRAQFGGHSSSERPSE